MYAASDFAGNETANAHSQARLEKIKRMSFTISERMDQHVLFASKSTLDRLRAFIDEPTASNLAKCALSMRTDLGRDSLDLEALKLN